MVNFKIYQFDGNSILLEYSEAVLSASALKLSNYLLSNNGNTISKIDVHDSYRNQYRIFCTNQFAVSNVVTINISGVASLDGTPVTPDARNFVVSFVLSGISSLQFVPAIRTSSAGNEFSTEYVMVRLLSDLLDLVSLTVSNPDGPIMSQYRMIDSRTLRVYSNEFQTGQHTLSLVGTFSHAPLVQNTYSMNFYPDISIKPRTIFVKNGIIVKPDVVLYQGTDLIISTPTTVTVSVEYPQSIIGKQIKISSGSIRNNGSFTIASVSRKVITIGSANLNNTNDTVSLLSLTTLINELVVKFNSHIMSTVYHPLPDPIDLVTTGGQSALNAAIICLNDLRNKFIAHTSKTSSGSSYFHKRPSGLTLSDFSPSTDLISAIYLANVLKIKFGDHLADYEQHDKEDTTSLVTSPYAAIVAGGAASGPYNYQIIDPNIGEVADNAADVSVTIDNNPVTPQYVFGMLGAVVLPTKPVLNSSIKVSYDFLGGMSGSLDRLNSFDYVINSGNKSVENNDEYYGPGIFGKKYLYKNYLINPKSGKRSGLSVNPKISNYKFQAIQRSCSSILNDPTSLLLNVPTNKISYPLNVSKASPSSLSYLPSYDTSLSWKSIGDGTSLVQENPMRLKISGRYYNVGNLNSVYPGTVSSTHKLVVNDTSEDLPGLVHVGFGFTDGTRLVLLNTMKTLADDLSSAIIMANDIRSQLITHAVKDRIHGVPDRFLVFSTPAASDLATLVALTKDLVVQYNAHVNRNSTVNIHKIISTNLTYSVTDLATSIVAINGLRAAFNFHTKDMVVHFNEDIGHVNCVKKLGVLRTNAPFLSHSSYDSVSCDWSSPITLRTVMKYQSELTVFLGDQKSQTLVLPYNSLPNSSEIPVSLISTSDSFFGGLVSVPGVTSDWFSVDVAYAPLGDLNYVSRREVSYSPSMGFPYENGFTVIGDGGYDLITPSPKQLIIDSMSYLKDTVDTISSNVHGYLKIDQSIDRSNTINCQFTFGPVDIASFGVTRDGLGFHISDGTDCVSVCFLQKKESEPKFGYSGTVLPESSSKFWQSYGNQPASIDGGVLRIVDSSTSNFRSYTYYDPHVTAPIMNANNAGYIADFRIKVNSYTAGTTSYFPGYKFCGGLFYVDEGNSGKYLEVHLAQDNSSTPQPCIVIASYNNGNSVYLDRAYFAWNDSKEHFISIRKRNSSYFIYCDAELKKTVPISSAYAGFYGPSYGFGTGASPTVAADLSSSKSDIIIHSATIVRESYSVERYVGIYRGGDVGSLNSYAINPVSAGTLTPIPFDWATAPHKYQVLRDPNNGVTLIIDDKSYEPIKMDSYSGLGLLPFFEEISLDSKFIAFGAFNQNDVSRSHWGDISFTVRNLSPVNGLVKSNSVLNAGNVITSQDHLKDLVKHTHSGYRMSSEGSPVLEYFEEQSGTVGIKLYDGTAPFGSIPDPGVFSESNKTVKVVSSNSFSSLSDSGFVNSYKLSAQDFINWTNLTPSSPTIQILMSYNLLASAFIRHSSDSTSHVTPKKITVTVGAGVDSNNIRYLSRDLYEKIRTHFTSTSLHCKSGTVIIPPHDETWGVHEVLNRCHDLYDDHLNDDGVHDNTVLIKISANPQDIYNAVKWYQEDTGQSGLISSYEETSIKKS